eukprot:symbB.v1.2.021651.t1/scaffold1746.1/size103363/9
MEKSLVQESMADMVVKTLARRKQHKKDHLPVRVVEPLIKAMEKSLVQESMADMVVMDVDKVVKTLARRKQHKKDHLPVRVVEPLIKAMEKSLVQESMADMVVMDVDKATVKMLPIVNEARQRPKTAQVSEASQIPGKNGGGQGSGYYGYGYNGYSDWNWNSNGGYWGMGMVPTPYVMSPPFWGKGKGNGRGEKNFYWSGGNGGYYDYPQNEPTQNRPAAPKASNKTTEDLGTERWQ